MRYVHAKVGTGWYVGTNKSKRGSLASSFVIWERERERKGGNVVSETQGGSREDRLLFRGEFNGNKAGLRERKEKEWDKAEGSNFLQRTNAKKNIY